MRLFILLFIIFIAGILVEGQDFLLSDFHEDPDGMPNEELAKKNIQISEKIILPAFIQVTAKGNGGLEIANLSLHVYDGHNDTAFYVNDLLNIYFVDINGDSCKDLVIWGMNSITSDKERYLGMHPVFFVAVFEPENKTFRTILASPMFDGFTPIAWEDYRFTRFTIPFVWTIYFIGYNMLPVREMFRTYKVIE